MTVQNACIKSRRPAQPACHAQAHRRAKRSRAAVDLVEAAPRQIGCRSHRTAAAPRHELQYLDYDHMGDAGVIAEQTG
jgi:hypothetical protein